MGIDDGTCVGEERRERRHSMNKRKIVLLLLTLALIASASIQPAIAYFTTYVRAKGGHTVSMGDTTTIVEPDVSEWKKTVFIQNKEGSEPVFIRAKVIYTDLSGKLGFTAAGTGWTALQADGYYYYSSVNPTTTEVTVKNPITNEDRKVKEMTGLTAVAGGAKTNSFIVTITNIPEEPEKGDTFSVTVLYESTPVRYHADGVTAYADWDAQIIEAGSTTGGNG